MLIAGVAALVGITLLMIISPPSAEVARRFLVKWGLPQPLPAQVDTARGYLRRRRLLYPVFWFLLPAAVALGASRLHVDVDLRRVWGLLSSVLAALLLAELFAALRPPRGRTRSAVLRRPRWRGPAARGGSARHAA